MHAHAKRVLLWLLLGASVGVACGASSAAFLASLEVVTQLRIRHPGLVWLLPIAGLVLGGVYERYGTPIRGGADLVLETIHGGRAQLPLRMAPMVAVGTLLTHLFGGSAGREGTAVQMGASLADLVAHRAKADSMLRRQLLVAGVAGGFGAVFGTPLAGLVFGLEYVT
ncbi:MAG: chloride channel protein, partial [Proteobacteria bacterium]